MEALGVRREKDACFFEADSRADSVKDMILTRESLQQIEQSGVEKELLSALAASAQRQFASFAKTSGSLGETHRLIALRDEVFKARMALWESMVEAARTERFFTDTELAFRAGKIDAAAQALAEAEAGSSRTARLRALSAHDKRLKERYSLQFDSGMIQGIDRLVGNTLNARPTLIVGDKGIAKTQIAKFVMSLSGHEPIVVSVKGDMMSDELIGKIKHDRELNSFVFKEGILLTAMRRGLPILLDEINFGDQAIIARLQDILLKRPGEQAFIQESGEEPIRIAPGFMVFATANEASQRYQSREVLDPAIRDRFDILTRSYPDLDGDPLTDASASLLRLALSSAVDAWGIPSPHIDLACLESYVQLAHITQYLYAVPAKDVSIDLSEDRMTSIVLEESQPLMTDCITPRTLSNTVSDCAAGNLPDMKLDAALIERSVRSLDQAGSTYNRELAEHIQFLLDVQTEPDRAVQEPSIFEGLSSKAFDAATRPQAF